MRENKLAGTFVSDWFECGLGRTDKSEGGPLDRPREAAQTLARPQAQTISPGWKGDGSRSWCGTTRTEMPRSPLVW